MKRFITILLVFCMSLSLIACESKELKYAKEDVDRIYTSTKQLATATDQYHIAGIKEVIEISIDNLEYNYKNLSDREKEILREYAEDAYEYNILNILD